MVSEDKKLFINIRHFSLFNRHVPLSYSVRNRMLTINCVLSITMLSYSLVHFGVQNYCIIQLINAKTLQLQYGERLCNFPFALFYKSLLSFHFKINRFALCAVTGILGSPSARLLFPNYGAFMKWFKNLSTSWHEEFFMITAFILKSHNCFRRKALL